jgi:hypothetical protein
MKRTVSAVAPSALNKLARGKTRKVTQKLQAAEQELHTANAALVDTLPPKLKQEVGEALEQTLSAEEKVREATEELEVVTELLALQQDHEDGSLAPPGQKSGHGAQSVMLHIRDEARGKPG